MEHKQHGMSKAIRRGILGGLILTGGWLLSLTVDVGLGEVLTGNTAQLPGHSLRGQCVRNFSGSVWLDGQRPWGLQLLLEESPILSWADGELKAGFVNCPEQENKAAHEPCDNDDLTEPELTPQQPKDSVVEMTGKGKTGERYIYGQGICLYNRTEKDLDAAVLGEGTAVLDWTDGPQILIVHTHGSEAFSQADGNLYEESDPYRTTDCGKNIVRVGEEMAAVFRGHGFRVLHDTNLYDYPAYNGSYDRSNAAVANWLKEYPSIRLVLDVHRDALVGKDGQIYKMVSTEAGEKVAQVMLVVGSDEAWPGHSRWKDNLALAVTLQRGLTKGYSSLARPIVLRSKTYNQELLPGSLLVEVGGHGNTLTEAIAGGRLWADNVARTLKTIMLPQK